MRNSIQRTLVLTLGEVGQTVGRRLQQILDEWGRPPVVAVRQLNQPSEEHNDIAVALHEISRLSHRSALHRLGYNTTRLSELAIWVVGGSDAPLSEVARLAHEQADASLSAAPLTMGIVLGAHDASITKSPQDEETKRRADDEASGTTETKGEASPERTVPLLPPMMLEEQTCQAFTGPCYLATPVNEVSLQLDDAAALYERVARFLTLHICTPLRDAPAWIEQARGWQDGRGYASFGLTWIAWPVVVARDRAERRLVKSLMPRLIGGQTPSPDADALLREEDLALPGLTIQLTPKVAREAVQSAAGDLTAWGLKDLFQPADGGEHPLVASLRAFGKSRETVLERCSPTWEHLMQEQVQSVTAATRDWVGLALDRAGFAGARALIEALERRLGDWASGAEQRRSELQGELPQMEDQAQSILAEMTALLATMPRSRLRDLLPLFSRPGHWVRIWRHWQEIQRLYGRYRLLQSAILETRVTIEQLGRACGVYWAAGSELQSITRELDRMELGLEERFEREGNVARWPDMPLLLGEAPDELLTAMMERYAPSPQAMASAFQETFGALSALWREGAPDRTAVAMWLAEQVDALNEISVWEVARCLHPTSDNLHAWLEELIARAAPLWCWDSASLSDGERNGAGAVTVLLGDPQELPWGGDELTWQVVPLNRGDGLGVVTLRWGIPAEDVGRS
jgi:hypothetical protein